MQGEVSVAKQLSGSECLEACITSLRQALAKDDRFMPHMAYHGFTAEIIFHFQPHESFAPPVDRTVGIWKGETTGPEGELISATVEIPLRPPNVVREEAGMPTPVLVTDSKGQSHEEWKKTGKVPHQAAIPHNKVKGA